VDAVDVAGADCCAFEIGCDVPLVEVVPPAAAPKARPTQEQSANTTISAPQPMPAWNGREAER
jgi:hypothetical protein